MDSEARSILEICRSAYLVVRLRANTVTLGLLFTQIEARVSSVHSKGIPADTFGRHVPLDARHTRRMGSPKGTHEKPTITRW